MNELYSEIKTKLSLVRTFSRNGRMMAECVCECGGATTTRLSRFQNSDVKSCGCLRGKFSFNGRAEVHGHARDGGYSPTYSSWVSMRDRCKNPNSPSWKYYGGKGIKIDPAWSRFDTFLSEMGERPSMDHTLDRVDGSLGYFRENCRWATYKVQNRNTSFNRILTVDGASLSVAEWAEKTGLPYFTISGRLRRGWPDEKAVKTPYLGRGGRIDCGKVTS